jgi:hypothetical protein
LSIYTFLPFYLTDPKFFGFANLTMTRFHRFKTLIINLLRIQPSIRRTLDFTPFPWRRAIQLAAHFLSDLILSMMVLPRLFLDISQLVFEPLLAFSRTIVPDAFLGSLVVKQRIAWPWREPALIFPD